MREQCRLNNLAEIGGLVLFFHLRQARNMHGIKKMRCMIRPLCNRPDSIFYAKKTLFFLPYTAGAILFTENFALGSFHCASSQGSLASARPGTSRHPRHYAGYAKWQGLHATGNSAVPAGVCFRPLGVIRGLSLTTFKRFFLLYRRGGIPHGDAFLSDERSAEPHRPLHPVENAPGKN